VTRDTNGAGFPASLSRGIFCTAVEKLGAIARKALEIRMQTIAY
jgi:hypothetical protein